MRRGIATTWHLVSFGIAAVLYFLFVLPRWWELTGSWSPGLGTAMRIVTGLLLALTAAPVLLTLLKSRKPEFGTPALALTLRTWSVVGHVAAGTLIVATAIAEIWLNLDDYGQWLFALYGAAAAMAVLGAAAFYLSFTAELPPPPPKPLKPKPERGRRGTASAEVDDAEVTAEDDSDETDAAPEVSAEDQTDESVEQDTEAKAEAEADADAEAEAYAEPDTETESAETEDKPARRRLRNRRPRKSPDANAQS